MRRMKTPAVLLAFLLILSACGVQQTESDAPPQEESGEDAEDITLYDCGGLQAALPTEYVNQLILDGPDGNDLLRVYEKASVEAAQAGFGSRNGFGFLFGFQRLDQAGLEQFLSSDIPGAEIFATDGERYYVYTFPTDVQFFRSGGEINIESEDWKTWEELNEIGPAVRDDFLIRNGLQSFSIQDYVDRLAAEDGNHVCLRYYPYFTKDGDTRVYYQLLLRQPARQGEGGVWAVDQWLDQFGNQYLYFPDSGKPATEYYAQLQEECNAGDHPELLTPAGAAAAFVRDFFGHETAEGSFEEVRGVDRGYAERNQRLSEIVLDVMFDHDVDGLELLDCIGGAAADNWGVLGRNMHGSDWFGPLMDAMGDAAVGENQRQRTNAVLSCLLATKDARVDFRAPLNNILRRQRDADPEVFVNALAGFLPECEPLLAPDLLEDTGQPIVVDVPTN